VAEPLGLGFDLGGTSLRVGLISSDGEVLEGRKIPAPSGGIDGLLEVITSAVASHPAGLPVGLGIAGLVDDGHFLGGSNLGLGEVDLAGVMAEAIGRPVTVGNDATLATLAEWAVGAGAGENDLIMMTIGTGVGGGLVTGGSLHLGHHGHAGELGHIVVVDGGRRCGCGQDGCLEAYVSGSSVGRWAKDLLEPGVVSVLRDIDDPTGGDLHRAAEAGDAHAAAVLRRSGQLLGTALASLANVLDPAVCILGGGAYMRSASYLLEPAREALARGIMGRPKRLPPTLVPAKLGDDAGMIGAVLAAAHPSFAATR
jgi:glucokinase